MKTKQNLREIVPELEEVDRYIGKVIQSNPQKMAQLNISLLNMKGKKLRPALFLCSARLHRKNVLDLIPLAVSLELIHTATLIHDDIVDEASLRRNMPTVNTLWGNQIAVLSGDYLFAKSITIITAFGNLEIIDLIANMVEKTAIGEIRQQMDSFNIELSQEEYLERIEQKTAIFIASCCLAACLTSDTDEKIKLAFYNFGLNLGIAFQIIDDVLDYTNEEKIIGKDSFSDLKNGIITLPLIHTFKHTRKRDDISRWINDRRLGKEELQFILSEIKIEGGVEYSIAMAQKYIEKAMYFLDQIPSKEVSNDLRAISGYVLKRSI